MRQKLNNNESFKELFTETFEGRQIQNIKDFSTDDMEKIISFSERKKATSKLDDPNYEPQELVGQFGEWKLWLPLTREDSVYIAQFNRETLEPDTTWCTARTSGSNLFYAYTTGGVLIFYAIKDGATRQDDDAFQSIGWKDGEVVDRKAGGMTVNRINAGISQEEHEKIFGSQFNAIFAAIKNKAGEIGGKHPFGEKIKAAALGDQEIYEDITQGVEKDGVTVLDHAIASERRRAASNPSDLSKEELKFILSSGDHHIKNIMFRSESLTTDAINALTEHGNLGEEEAYKVITSPLLVDETLRLLSKSGTTNRYPKLRPRIAEHPKASTETLSALADEIISILTDEDLMLPRGYRISALTPPTQRKLESLERIIQHPSVSAEVIDKIAEKVMAENTLNPYSENHTWGHSSMNQVARIMAESKISSPGALSGLAEVVPWIVAGNPRTPEETLRDLHSRSRGPHRELASNTSTPPDILTEYTGEKYSYFVRERAAKNPSLPVSIILSLLKEGDLGLEHLVQNPSVPPDILVEMAKDGEEETKIMLTLNPSLPAEAWTILSTDPDVAVQRNVAGSLYAPEDVLNNLAKSEDDTTKKWALESLDLKKREK